MIKPLPWLHWAVLLIVKLTGVSCCRQRQVEDSLCKIFTFEQIAKEVDTVCGVHRIAGIKAYFGLMPDHYDSNQRMAGITPLLLPALPIKKTKY